VEDAVAKLREYIEHRERREAEILAIIDKSTTLTNDGGGGVTPMQITYQVYPVIKK
jgi:hypothetical protein